MGFSSGMLNALIVDDDPGILKPSVAR